VLYQLSYVGSGAGSRRLARGHRSAASPGPVSPAE